MELLETFKFMLEIAREHREVTQEVATAVCAGNIDGYDPIREPSTLTACGNWDCEKCPFNDIESIDKALAQIKQLKPYEQTINLITKD